MRKDKNINLDTKITVKAISIKTNEILFQGRNGEEVMKKADESGENYILDFETDPGYNFVF